MRIRRASASRVQVLPPSMTLVIRHWYTTSLDGQRVLMPVLDQSTPSVISVGQWK